MNDLPKVTLYSTVGGSDKVYCLEILAQGDGYVVNFANGRRGGTLQHGTKTQNPVKLDAAQKIYDKVYKEKTGKGYTAGEGERAFTGTDMANRVSGLLPQLSNAVTRAEMEALILDPHYMLQEKKDGNRTMARKVADAAEGVNRKGLTIPLPKEVSSELELLGGKLTLDGELVDATLWVFDCLVSPMEGEVTKRGVKERYEALVSVISSLDGMSKGGLVGVKLVEAAFTTAEKRALFDRVEAEGGEGVVAKLITAEYEVGRPSKGGNHLKFKFRESASVIVVGINDKRSVQMAVLDGGKVVEVGNVTIPPNKAVPKVDDLIEVSYLYAFRGGSLFQPIYHGLRTDIDRAECVIGQLKFKDA